MRAVAPSAVRSLVGIACICCHFVAFGAYKAGIGGDGFVDVLQAALDLFGKVGAQRARELAAHGGDLGAHLGFGAAAAGGDDKEAQRGDRAGQDDPGHVDGQHGGEHGDDGSQPNRADFRAAEAATAVCAPRAMACASCALS